MTSVLTSYFKALNVNPVCVRTFCLFMQHKTGKLQFKPKVGPWAAAAVAYVYRSETDTES